MDYYDKNNGSYNYPRQSSGEWYGDKPNPYGPYGDPTKYKKQNPFSDNWAEQNPWMKELNKKSEEKARLKARRWICINWKRIPKKLFSQT